MGIARDRARKTALTGVLAVALAAAAPAIGPAQDLEGHPESGDSADLTRAEAIDYYQSIVDRMQRLYAISRDPLALRYREWHRYNDAPYLSATHGNRFVNNYANLIARRAGYGRFEPGDRMPPGAVIAKDSLTVTRLRERLPGALFLMQKLMPGTSPDTGDWRYVMIMPDGSYFGDTTGIAPENVRFCHDCHSEQAETDHLFFVPEDVLFTVPELP